MGNSAMGRNDHDRMERLFDEMSDRAYRKFDKMIDEAVKDKSATVIQVKPDSSSSTLYFILAVCIVLLYILQFAAQCSLDSKIAKLDDRLNAFERRLWTTGETPDDAKDAVVGVAGGDLP